jgi:hypothetical protein
MTKEQLFNYRRINSIVNHASTSDDLELFKTVAHYPFNNSEKQNILNRLLIFNSNKIFRYYLENCIKEQDKLKMLSKLHNTFKNNITIKSSQLFLYIQNQLRLSKLKNIT